MQLVLRRRRHIGEMPNPVFILVKINICMDRHPEQDQQEDETEYFLPMIQNNIDDVFHMPGIFSKAAPNVNTSIPESIFKNPVPLSFLAFPKFSEKTNLKIKGKHSNSGYFASFYSAQASCVSA